MQIKMPKSAPALKFSILENISFPFSFLGPENSATGMAESLKAPGSYIEAIFQLCRRLLNKDLNQYLDKMAEDRVVSIPSYPYKSFSETLYFVVTSMLRELLQSSAGKYL